MEDDEHRRRQHERLNYPRGYATDYGSQGSNLSNLQQLRGGQGDDNADRFRQGQLLGTRAPVSTPLLAGAGGPQDLGTFAYSQGQQYQMPQMQAPPFHYPPEYLQDPPRQRFSPYTSQMMYNGPQQPPTQSPYNVAQQPHPQSPYDPPGEFQPRQIAAIEVLSNQFGAPSHYYSAGEAPNASAPVAMSHGYQTATFQPPLQYNASNALGRSTLASSYSAMPLDFNQAGSAEEQPSIEPDVAAENNDRYYRVIGETNHNTSRGLLVEAGNSLMHISNRLLIDAVRLGFTQDEQTMHAQRLALWDSFNNCWLALLQRQLAETRKQRDTGRSPVPPQSLLPAATLESMGDELVAHCDSLEKIGLVDYQIGVSEEEIIDMLNRCLDLLRTDEEEGDRAEGGSTTNLPVQRRGNR